MSDCVRGSSRYMALTLGQLLKVDYARVSWSRGQLELRWNSTNFFLVHFYAVLRGGTHVGRVLVQKYMYIPLYHLKYICIVSEQFRRVLALVGIQSNKITKQPWSSPTIRRVGDEIYRYTTPPPCILAAHHPESIICGRFRRRHRERGSSTVVYLRHY